MGFSAYLLKLLTDFLKYIIGEIQNNNNERKHIIMTKCKKNMNVNMMETP